MRLAHAIAASLMLASVPARAGLSAWAPPEAPADGSTGWWLLVEDLGCGGCRAEVVVSDQLVVVHPSGRPDVIVDVGPLLRPGTHVVEVIVRGPPGPGRMAVSLGRGRIHHDVIVFDGDPIRYALAPAPAPLPTRFEVTVDL